MLEEDKELRIQQLNTRWRQYKTKNTHAIRNRS